MAETEPQPPNHKPAPDPPGAALDMFPLVYAELRRLAQSELRRAPAGQTLQATALVHDVWLRLAERDGTLYENRAHFFAVAAKAIRQIVMDNARRKSALKRGGDLVRVELDRIAVSTDVPTADLMALDDALNELSKRNENATQIVNLRYFAGLTVDAIAELLRMSKRSVEREWEYARAWLLARIRASGAEAPSSEA